MNVLGVCASFVKRAEAMDERCFTVREVVDGRE